MSTVQTTGQAISLTEAAGLTAQYRAQNPSAPLANLFGSNIIMQVLSQPGAVGIRIYYGLSTGTTGLQLVLVGVDVNGNDIVPGVYGDRSEICPPMCSTSNPINGL